MSRSAHRDLAFRGTVVVESPEPSRGQVTHDRVAPGGEDSRHAVPVVADVFVADGVDAAMDTNQAKSLVGARDLSLREAELAQLAKRHNAMLSRCQFGQSPMRSHFSPHIGDKGPEGRISPPGERLFA